MLDEELTVFQTIDDVARGEIRNKIRDLLGAFMFGGDNSTKKVKVLSGGERTRLAMLSDAVAGFRKSKVYSQLGLGILIKNENLIFSTFQISISYYPIIPGIGPDVFKQNVYKTTDFKFRDFNIGKPETAAYQ